MINSNSKTFGKLTLYNTVQSIINNYTGIVMQY